MLLHNFKVSFGLFRCAVLIAMCVCTVTNKGQAQVNDWSEYASTVTWRFSQPATDLIGLRRSYFDNLSRNDVRAIVRTADDPIARTMFSMLYKPHRSRVPDNLTDADLAALGSNPKRLKQQAASAIGALSEKQIRNLENFDPFEINNLIHGTVVPGYVVLPKPPGASTTTWASESLNYSYRHIRLAAIAKRSVLVRLLEDEGYISIPTNTTLYFVWSGTPDIPIDLQFTRWQKSDVPKLTKLYSSLTYSNLAAERVELILNGQ